MKASEQRAWLDDLLAGRPVSSLTRKSSVSLRRAYQSDHGVLRENLPSQLFDSRRCTGSIDADDVLFMLGLEHLFAERQLDPAAYYVLELGYRHAPGLAALLKGRGIDCYHCVELTGPEKSHGRVEALRYFAPVMPSCAKPLGLASIFELHAHYLKESYLAKGSRLRELGFGEVVFLVERILGALGRRYTHYPPLDREIESYRRVGLNVVVYELDPRSKRARRAFKELLAERAISQRIEGLLS